MSDLYQEIVLEHVEHPYNLARFSGVTHTVKDANASCGDLIELQLKVEKGIIKEVKAWCWCTSTASTSIPADIIQGKTLQEAQKLPYKTPQEMA